MNDEGVGRTGRQAFHTSSDNAHELPPSFICQDHQRCEPSFGCTSATSFCVGVSATELIVTHIRLGLHLRIGALLLGIASPLVGQPPISGGERTAMIAQFAADVSTLDKAIEENPRDAMNFSRRGDRFLFLGNFAAAVADFERMIVLDPAHDAPHWRLGIAYYFAQQFAKSSKQFEKYHGFDGADRENGIWKFLADVKLIGLEPARRAMLVYTRYDREPFPALYEMFSGRMSTDEFLANLKARSLTGNQRVMFFAS